jgi:hypothetical protein
MTAGIRSIANGLLAALAIALSPSGVQSQFLRSPVFMAQPGMRTVDAISPLGEAPSSSGFNLRIVTEVPTRWERLRFQFGASFLPFGYSNGARADNEPSLFYGAILPLVLERHTAGWLELALPLLGIYQIDVTGIDPDPLYEYDFVVEAAIKLNVGRKLLGDLGPYWSRVNLYLLVDQTLTPNVDLGSGKTDRFNPAFMYGLTLPIAGR